MPIQQSHSRQASLWQSALDEATAKESGGAAASLSGAKRTSKRAMDQDIAANDAVIKAIERQEFQGVALPDPLPPSPGAGVQDTVKFCSTN